LANTRNKGEWGGRAKQPCGQINQDGLPRPGPMIRCDVFEARASGCLCVHVAFTSTTPFRVIVLASQAKTSRRQIDEPFSGKLGTRSPAAHTEEGEGPAACSQRGPCLNGGHGGGVTCGAWCAPPEGTGLWVDMGRNPNKQSSNQANKQTSKQATKETHSFSSFFQFSCFLIFWGETGGFLLLGTTRRSQGKPTRTHTIHGGCAFLVEARDMCVGVCMVLYRAPNLIAGGGRRIEHRSFPPREVSSYTSCTAVYGGPEKIRLIARSGWGTKRL
jgi:hypothetical protein